MSKNLVIVESPNKCATIEKYLGKDYKVVASKGHVRDLPEKEVGVDVEHNFEPTYVALGDKNMDSIKKTLPSYEKLLLATDGDREGESIAWHLVQLLHPTIPYKRVVFHEITKKGVKEGLAQERDIDMNLVKAQEDRRIIDRLYGYDISPVLWRRLSNKSLSAGRVQSPGLRFLIDKENTRLKYKVGEYWGLVATCATETGEKLALKLDEVDGKKVATGSDFDSETGEFLNKATLLDEEAALALEEELKTSNFVVASVMQKPSSQGPYPPFTTSTLQMAASRIGFSSKVTMTVAQHLFERGFITYMRTDSTFLSPEAISEARSRIVEDYGEEYLNPTERHFKTRTLNAQEAHEAIRPAGEVFRRPRQTGLTGRELKLYTLIYNRTLQTQMRKAEKSTTTVCVNAGRASFSASGTVIIFPGFLKVYESEEEKDDERRLPSLSAGETLSLKALNSKAHITEPPARYTEASFIKALEEKGIGRPSTYATIISTILERKYAVKLNKSLVPTFVGYAVNNVMETYFAPLITYDYTARMEEELDKVASGAEDYLIGLKQFYYGEGTYAGLEKLVDEAKNARDGSAKTLKFDHLSGVSTLEDGRSVSYQIKVGPYGAYLSTDIENDKGKSIMPLPDNATPGEMNDEKIQTLVNKLFSPEEEEADENAITLHAGRFGQYWKRGEKTCPVPRGRKKAEEYTGEEIEFLLSLPRVIAKDDQGYEITLCIGSYGGYLKYKENNFKVFGSLTEVTAEKALAIIGKENRKGKVKDYEPIDGKSVSLMYGRYGLYVKWGDENVRIPRGEDEETLTQSEIEALCKKGPKKAEKVAKPSRNQSGQLKEIGLIDGKPTYLMSGRYGLYLKSGDENFRLPRGLEASNIDVAKAQEIIAETRRSRKPVKDFGLFEGESLLVMSGRYGLYLKHGDKNIALPSKYKKDVSDLSEEEAKSIAGQKK